MAKTSSSKFKELSKSEPVESRSEPIIHVMPEEFRAVKKKPLLAVKWIFVIAGVVLLSGALAGIFFFVPGFKKRPPLIAVPPAPEVKEEAPEAAPEIPKEVEEEIKVEAPRAPLEEIVPPPAVLALGSDRDADGLSDTEEDLYQTDPLKPDTDRDGFLDGNEVFHLYNPAAIAPVNLVESGLVKSYTSTTTPVYEIYYPASWVLRPLEGVEGAVIFVSQSGEFAGVLLEENPENKSLIEWYGDVSPGADIARLEKIETKRGYKGIQSPDRLTTYIAKEDKIFVISYNVGDKTVINYRRTYEMMLNSFLIKEVD